MDSPNVTSWTIIQEAAEGADAARAEFATRYTDVIRACLARHWRGSAFHVHIDDAIQDVFVECFRHGGILEKADPERPGGFRAFLAGVTFKIAKRIESKKFRNRERPAETQVVESVEHDDPSLSTAFDQAWVKMIMREAWQTMGRRAKEEGGATVRHLELIKLRFGSGLPIRKIAEEWSEDAAVLHRQFRSARKAYEADFLQALSRHHGGTPEQLKREGARLLALFE